MTTIPDTFHITYRPSTLIPVSDPLATYLVFPAYVDDDRSPYDGKIYAVRITGPDLASVQIPLLHCADNPAEVRNAIRYGLYSREVPSFHARTIASDVGVLIFG